MKRAFHDGASFGSLGAKEREREIREGEKQGDKEEKAGREGAGLEELGAADGELAARWSGPGGAALDPPWIEAQEEGRRRGAACSSSRERVALGVGHE